MTTTPEEFANLLAPDAVIAQSRLARLVLAYMTGDALISTSVFVEIDDDGRGSDLALRELVLALTASLAIEWANDHGRDAAIGHLRTLLAKFESGEVAA